MTNLLKVKTSKLDWSIMFNLNSNNKNDEGEIVPCQNKYQKQW